MDSPLDDPKRRPTEALLQEVLGRAAGTWTALFDALAEAAPDLEQTWNYYRDGHAWLLKVTRQKKTVCWVSVQRGGFRVGFYFPARVTPALLESSLSAARKRALRTTPATGKLQGVSVPFGPRSGVRDVLTLVSLKQTLK
ncbi:MAG: DUF3788 family protein [Myxococcota bacterium]